MVRKRVRDLVAERFIKMFDTRKDPAYSYEPKWDFRERPFDLFLFLKSAREALAGRDPGRTLIEKARTQPSMEAVGMLKLMEVYAHLKCVGGKNEVTCQYGQFRDIVIRFLFHLYIQATEPSLDADWSKSVG